METPLTPLEFARRARKLYGGREAVVDGDLRLTYEQFFDRCDRWSAALQGMGVRKGDRVAYIAPNTHEQLESFYAVPQIGAVLVPINYRLTADDFVYITSHSGAKVLCVHPDYLEAVDGVRGPARQASSTSSSLGPRRRPQGLVGVRAALCAQVEARLRAPGDRRDRPARAQLHERHDRQAEGRDDHAPQRVDQRRRARSSTSTSRSATATCGRCRCSTPTAGRSCGSSPPSAARTSACPRSSRPGSSS